MYIRPTPFYHQVINNFITYSRVPIFACLVLKMLMPSKLAAWWREITLDKKSLILQTKTPISRGASRLTIAARCYCWHCIVKFLAYCDIVTVLYVVSCLKNVLGKRWFIKDRFGWIANLFSIVMMRLLC